MLVLKGKLIPERPEVKFCLDTNVTSVTVAGMLYLDLR